MDFTTGYFIIRFLENLSNVTALSAGSQEFAS
jgi:hypothetical protein